MKFSSSIPGSITGVRFYKATNSTGIHTGTLWSAAGVKLATGTFTGETASGWQTLMFSAPVTINAATSYIASYHTAQYAYSNNYFAAALSVPPLTAPIGAGLYAYGTTSALPGLSFQNSNYWVDVLFAPSGPPPVTISIAPASKTLVEMAAQQFTATVGNTANTAVAWAVTGALAGNVIDANGLFMAGPTPGNFTITATSSADTTKSATAAVTVTAPLPSLMVDCAAVKVAFTEMNMPAGAVLSVSAMAGGASATCVIPLP